jgi:SAM-dependent methyltransferase
VAETLQQRAERVADGRFLGGPLNSFEGVGRMGLEVLLKQGLRPSSRVLDVGCGALRLGYWLMRLLDPGCYYGIEPNREMLAIGLHEIVEPDVLARADAHFDANEDFDFSVFGTTFDYVVARSIWTHCSKDQISAQLASFAATSAEGGAFLASYSPASPLFPVIRRSFAIEQAAVALPLARIMPALAKLPPLGDRRAYKGTEWVGRSHRSDVIGGTKHSLSWIWREAARNGLVAELLPYRVMNHQLWLKVSRQT